VWSALRAVIWRPAAAFTSPRSSSFHHVIVRPMSGGHKKTMVFVPSNFEWRRFKDHLNFYLMLGIIPIAITITAANLFVGPAQLADIPEGYEPKHWEYFRSPISRFIARHFLESPEKNYERHMHFLNEEKERMIMRKLEKKVKMLVGDVGQRYDSKRWYYIPTNVDAPKAGRSFYDSEAETQGYRPV